MSSIPVTLLTGFLGSGKSTLLSHILRAPEFAKTAVIVNEFGEVGLDDFLVIHSEEQIVEMTTGCLCCTIRGDISETLRSLFQKREAGDIPFFERVIIETTGLADPAPVLHTLMTEPFASSDYLLCGVICTLDILNAEATLSAHEESVKQVALADRLILTKTDMSHAPQTLYSLQRKVRALNPSALIIDKTQPDFDILTLFETALIDHTDKSERITEWLGAHEVEHHHSHHHGDDISTFHITIDRPVSAQAFVLSFQLLMADHGEKLLRIKGIVNVEGQSERPIVIHGVQHVFHEPVELPGWPDESRSTKLVFITQNLPRQQVEKYIQGWLKSEHAS